jgi:hypothetical protein
MENRQEALNWWRSIAGIEQRRVFLKYFNPFERNESSLTGSEVEKIWEKENKPEANTSQATLKLSELWDEMKQEGDCTEYVKEMCAQLKLLGTETNTRTKLMVYNRIKEVYKNIEKSIF